MSVFVPFYIVMNNSLYINSFLSILNVSYLKVKYSLKNQVTRFKLIKFILSYNRYLQIV